MGIVNQTSVLHFFLTLVFSFVIGLELNSKKGKEGGEDVFFGTERTLAFIGMLAFILMEAGSVFAQGYLIGWISLSALLGIFYYSNITRNGHFGFTKVLVAEFIYLLPLLLRTQPIWFSLLIIVVFIILLDLKEQIKRFSERIYAEEFLTMAKFVVITGVILPLAPRDKLVGLFSFSLFDLWMAVVAISGISYISYLLQKYLFPKSGIIVSGLLGGLYSSTAATFLLARKSRDDHGRNSSYAAGILLSTVMMLARVFVLMWLFNREVARASFLYFALLIPVSLLMVVVLYRWGGNKPEQVSVAEELSRQNPLEFKMALVFSVLYVVFSMLTEYTVQHYGRSGLPVLSFVVGLADIDPFLISLFQNEQASLSSGAILLSAWQTITANNILKMVYALVMSGVATRKLVFWGFLVINVVCGGVLWILW